MKETIYTIPVTEAFETPCECPLCILESRFEKECVDYFLGPSLMEPENRIETNQSGFCGRHFTQMYNTQTNRLGLGLILHTYMTEQNKQMQKISAAAGPIKKKSLFSSSSGEGGKAAERMLKYLQERAKECCICKKLDFTMDRYIEVIVHLYFSEKDFRSKFDGGMGFCLPHLQRLIEGSQKYLPAGKQNVFLEALLKLQAENLKRIEDEVEWFTKKFDYRNQDAPWGNSRDAVARGIKKMTGVRDLGQ